MASKVEQIIDHFTTDTQLKMRILQAIAANKGRTPSLSSVLSGFNIDPALQGRILDFVNKVRNGHDIDAIAGYYKSDRQEHEDLRNTVAYHQGAVKSILAQ